MQAVAEIKRRLPGLAGLFWLLLSAPAGAQPPGRLNLVLDGEVGARDDGEPGLAQDPALRKGRTVSRAGFDFRLSYALERLSLALGYSPYYERALDSAGDRFSGMTHRLDFGLVGDLNRQLRLNVRENLISTPNLDLYTPVTTTETMVVTRNGNQLNHLLDVFLDQAFGRRASMVAGVTHSLRRYEDSNLVDSETLGGRLGAAFELVRGSRVEAGLAVERYDYERRGTSDIRIAGVAYATDLGRDNHLRVDAGAFSADSTLRRLDGVGPAGRESDSGWRGGLRFARDERLFHWTLGASHDISPGVGLGRPVTADNSFLGVSTAVGRRLTLGLDGNVSRQRDLANQGALLPTESQTLTRFAAGTVRAGWSFAPAFRLEGGYSRVWQRAQVAPFADLSYSRYYLSLAFRLYSTGETPLKPATLGRPAIDEKSDNQ